MTNLILLQPMVLLRILIVALTQAKAPRAHGYQITSTLKRAFLLKRHPSRSRRRRHLHSGLDNFLAAAVPIHSYHNTLNDFKARVYGQEHAARAQYEETRELVNRQIREAQPRVPRYPLGERNSRYPDQQQFTERPRFQIPADAARQMYQADTARPAYQALGPSFQVPPGQNMT
jgi:hypothetical protein